MSRTFYCTMSYEVHASVPPESRKLLLAELVGRRWQDRLKGDRLPAGTVFMNRNATAEQTTSDLFQACLVDLRAAAEAVARMGRPMKLGRAWVQVAGAGSYGLAGPEVLEIPAK